MVAAGVTNDPPTPAPPSHIPVEASQPAHPARARAAGEGVRISRLRMRRIGFALLWAAIGLSALLLLAKSVQNSTEFGRLQPWILLLNIIGVIALVALLTRKLWQLVRDYRDHVPGSRLTARTVAIFGALVVAPLLIVYLSSLEFLNRGIDSWFRVEVKQGLSDALVLSRGSLDVRMREYAQRTEQVARSLAQLSSAEIASQLDGARRSSGALEIAVIGENQRVIAASLENALESVPSQPTPDLVRQVSARHSFMSLEPEARGQYLIRTAAPFASEPSADNRYVMAVYRVPPQIARLSEAVQHAYSQYGDLAALREPLKYSFRLTLTLVLLLAMLAAIYGAIFFAQRMVRPVQDLIAGTRAVGKGDFDTRLPLPSRDEMGFLVHSFNDMTKRLRRAHDEATRSHEALLSAQRDAAWGEVARRLAHEIKNPLTPIQLSAERLRKRFLSTLSPQDAEVMERATRTIIQQVETMKQMVNAFSEYARAPEMQIAPFSLNALIAEVADLYRASERHTDIHLQLDQRIGSIEADRGRVRQLLNNLVTNSLQALEGVPGPRLDIETRLEQSGAEAQVVIVVGDNGPGFQRELLARVFDPYVTSKAKGTGLGLAIVKKIVEEHGGRIEADNRPEGGARVQVVLPARATRERLAEQRRQRA